MRAMYAATEGILWTLHRELLSVAGQELSTVQRAIPKAERRCAREQTYPVCYL